MDQPAEDFVGAVSAPSPGRRPGPWGCRQSPVSAGSWPCADGASAQKRRSPEGSAAESSPPRSSHPTALRRTHRRTARPGPGSGTGTGRARSPRSMSRFRACWVVHAPSGCAVAPDMDMAAADLRSRRAFCGLLLRRSPQNASYVGILAGEDGLRPTEPSALGLPRNEYVQAPQGHRAVGVEEKSARQHRRGMRVQELPPRGAAALRRGRNPQPSQNPPHRGMPPLNPAGPCGIGSLDAGRVVAAGAHRRIAVAERDNHALQRVKRRLVLSGRRPPRSRRARCRSSVIVKVSQHRSPDLRIDSISSDVSGLIANQSQ